MQYLSLPNYLIIHNKNYTNTRVHTENFKPGQNALVARLHYPAWQHIISPKGLQQLSERLEPEPGAVNINSQHCAQLH